MSAPAFTGTSNTQTPAHLMKDIVNGDGAVMLVCDETSAMQIGLRHLVGATLARGGRKVIFADSVSEGPTAQTLASNCSIARDNDVQLVIALGRGSSYSLARGISACTWCEGDPWAKYFFNMGTPSRNNIPLGTVFAAGEPSASDPRQALLDTVFGPQVVPVFSLTIPKAKPARRGAKIA